MFRFVTFKYFRRQRQSQPIWQNHPGEEDLLKWREESFEINRWRLCLPRKRQFRVWSAIRMTSDRSSAFPSLSLSEGCHQLLKEPHDVSPLSPSSSLLCCLEAFSEVPSTVLCSNGSSFSCPFFGLAYSFFFVLDEGPPRQNHYFRQLLQSTFFTRREFSSLPVFSQFWRQRGKREKLYSI